MANLNNELLKQALNSLANEEFENIEAEPSFTPSQKFESKMEKLIKRASKPYYKFTATGMRRAICVIAAVLVLMLSTLSANAVRETVSEVFEKVFSSEKNEKIKKPESTTSNVNSNSNSNNKPSFPKTIETVYELSYIPDGFALDYFDCSDAQATTSFTKNGEKLVLKQFTKHSFAKEFKSQSFAKEVVVLNNQKYKIYTLADSNQLTVVWSNEDYAFTLSCWLSKDEALKVCQSVRVKVEPTYPTTIETVYELGYVPEGFKLIEKIDDSCSVLYKYSSTDKSIKFIQSVKSAYLNIETENAIKWTETYGEKEFKVYTWENGFTNIVFENDDYKFSIHSDLSKDEILNLCNNVRVVEKKDYPQTIEKVYEFDSISSSFKLSKCDKQQTTITTKYTSNNDFVELKQYTKDTYSTTLDFENATKTQETIDGKEFTVYLFENGETMLVFEAEDYIFAVRSTLSKEQIAKLCNNLTVKEAPTTTTQKTTTTTKKPTDKIEQIYEFGYLPSDVLLIDYLAQKTQVTYVYSLNDETIMFSQSTKSTYSSSVDKTQATKTTKIFNDQNYTIYTFANGNVNVVWSDGEYIFDLYGKLDLTEVFKMCKSIKAKQN